VYTGVGALRIAKAMLNPPRAIAVKVTRNFLFLRIRQYSLRLISYWGNPVHLDLPPVDHFTVRTLLSV
jgi:hypothetical protein